MYREGQYGKKEKKEWLRERERERERERNIQDKKNSMRWEWLMACWCNNVGSGEFQLTQLIKSLMGK